MKEYSVTSPEETEALGYAVGTRLLSSGRRHLFLAFFGEMGVGKTAFSRGVTAAIAPGAAVRSPTYTVVNEYRGGSLPIYHFDMYRIEDADDLASIGYDDYLAAEGLILCEWSENIKEEIPAEALTVRIERTGDTARRILFEGDGYEDLMP